MVFHFLAESVFQSREAAHVHAHREVLAFHEAGADLFRSGFPLTTFMSAPMHFAGGVARFVLHRSTVNVLQPRVIAVHAERTFDRIKVHPVPVRGDLDGQ